MGPMFYAREQELRALRTEFQGTSKSASLVYGKRRVGKSTLIAEASKGFEGVVVNYLCARTSYQGNVALLCRSVSQALGLPTFTVPTIFDVFDLLKAQGRRILVIIDEYQYLKESLRVGEMDSYMQAVIDTLDDNVKLVLCGSYVTVMRELLQEDNPLFGRFTCIVHLDDMDYLDAHLFCPRLEVSDKIAFYAVFGGSPYVLSCLDYTASVEDNVRRLLLPANSVLRTHVESIMLAEIRRGFDVRILEALGNGRRRYSDIASALGGDSNGLLDKQLKNLMGMEAVAKVSPINRTGDRRKTYYELRDNLMRFYYTYLFAREATIARIGEDAFFQSTVRPSLRTFESLRFEAVVAQYFQRKARAGLIEGVEDVGTFWYDDSRTRTSGQFDCVVRRQGSYTFYEAKYYLAPMGLAACRAEEEQVRAIPGMERAQVGFVCSAGFDFASDAYELISGGELYEVPRKGSE